MNTFLGEVCESILSDQNNPEKTALVLPTKRAGLFFKQELAKRVDKASWTPQVITINELTEKISGNYPADPISLSFELYPIYVKIFGDKAKEFDEFLQLSSIIITDFSEIDAYLIDPKELFRDLKEFQELETWSFNLGELSENQKTYSDFWNKLGVLYEAFNEHLNKKDFSYSGRITKKATEVAADFLKKDTFDHYYFAGFNAFSKAESRLIKILKDAGKATVIWDYDDYYLLNNINEAGKFLRRTKKENPEEFSKKKSYFEAIPKTFQITGAQLLTDQAEIACAHLSNLSSEELTKTALVLADESILLPVLNRLPENVSKVNISMGLSLAEGTFYNLTEVLFSLNENFGKLGEANKFYYKDVLNILEHPAILANSTHANELKNIANEIRKQNVIFIDKEVLFKLSKGKLSPENELLLSQIIKPFTAQPVLFINEIIQILQLLVKTAKHLDEEFLYREVVVLSMLKSKFNTFPEIGLSSLRTLKKIVLKALRSDSLSFIGEPLEGLQIMGMLETRALDFDRIIILSANEGVLPAVKRYDSFIPYDIKNHHKLPGKREREAIFAYHFYRLLQRASNVSLIYSTNREVDGGGEKSRFISQLEYELPKLNANSKFEYPIFEQPFINDETEDFEIVKTEAIIESIKSTLEYGISPSSLNAYTSCPLDWYFKYVLGMRDLEEVEEEIASSTLGSAIHDALEELYTPFLNEKLTAEKLEGLLPEFKTLLKNNFTKHHSSEGFRFGVNHISFEASLYLGERYLKQEIIRLKEYENSNKQWQLLKLEEQLSAELNFMHGDSEIKLKLSGKADRIEKLDGVIKVADYKTGKVDKSELNLKEISDIKNKQKSLQLMAYAYCYYKMYNDPNIISTIIPLRYSDTGDLSLSINGESVLDTKSFEDFEKEIKTLAGEILDETIPFQHNPDAKYCKWCQ